MNKWIKRKEYQEDLESSNIEDTNKRSTLPLASVQWLVYSLHDPLEHALINRLGYGFNSKLDLFLVLRFGHKVTTDFEFWLKQRTSEVGYVQTEQITNFLGNYF